MTGQTRIWSAVESVTNVVVGYCVAVATQYAVFPLFDIEVTHADQLAIGAIFTVVSLVRSYLLRRGFNCLHEWRYDLDHLQTRRPRRTQARSMAAAQANGPGRHAHGIDTTNRAAGSGGDTEARMSVRLGQ